MRHELATWSRCAILAALAALMLALPAQSRAGQGTAPQEDAVTVEMVPLSKSVVVGDTFEIQVMIRAADNPVTGAQAYLNFNPRRLECLEVIPGNTLTDLFPVPDGPIDNVKGQINFAAGKLLGDAPSGTFELMTVRLRALSVTSGTNLSYSTEQPRATTVVGNVGHRYPLLLLESQISAAPGAKVISLPLILRN